jgi:hypothetical protein
VAWTDDEGETWSPLYVERRTPAWVGGFPDITVDSNPSSPSYGVVYVAYNWLASAQKGPGLRVIASGDFGATWQATEIPAVPGPAGYDAAWRIADRIRAAPDGSAFVSSYQANLRTWDSSRIFVRGGAANVGRIGIAVARIRLDRQARVLAREPGAMAITFPENAYTVSSASPPGTAGLYVDPGWTQSLDVDPVSGRVLLAVAWFQAASSAAQPRAAVRVGRSDDAGRTWDWVTVPPLDPLDGLAQSSYRPSIVAGPGYVFVGFHALTDLTSSSGSQRATVGTAYAVSFGGGWTFEPPRMATPVRWSGRALTAAQIGAGLRERADRAANGTVFFVYGDGRLAGTSGTSRRSAVFGTSIVIPLQPPPGPDPTLVFPPD